MANRTYYHSSSTTWRVFGVNAAVRYVTLLLAATTLCGGDAWAAGKVWIRQGPEGGIINALAIGPQSPATVYAGTQSGGVFKSTDGGTTWSAVNVGLTDLEVLSLATDPQSPATVYAGTQSGDVFKSTDGGTNWSGVNNGLTTFNVRSLAIDPQNPTTLYLCSDTTGIFKSTNGGANWYAVNAGLTSLDVMSLAIAPQNTAIGATQARYW